MPAPAEAYKPRYLDLSYVTEARERGVEFERRPRQRVVILGSEMATPFGNEEKTMAALFEGRSAIRYLGEGRNFYTNIGGTLPSPDYDAYDEIDKSDSRFKKGGELYDLAEHKRKHHRAGNFRMAAIAIDMAKGAARKAGIWDDEKDSIKEGIVRKTKTSSVVASGYGEGQRIIDIWKHLWKDGIAKVRAHSKRMDVRDVMATFPEELNAQTEIAMGAQGWSVSSPEACATSGSAIAEAARLIRDGYTDLAFAGGLEDALREYMPVTLGMFGGPRALAEGFDLAPTKGSRPWSMSRNGFVPSSGGGMLCVAALDWVIEQGLEDRIQGEIVGFAKGSDASTDNPLMDSQRVADVAAHALYDEATGKMYDPDIVAAHATGTPQGDSKESQAYRMLGINTRRFTAVKSMLGHLLGGAGAVNAIVAKNMLFQYNEVPQTINCEDRDPEFNDVNIVEEHPDNSKDADIVLATALGFGGKNSALAIRRWRPEFVQEHIKSSPHLQKYFEEQNRRLSITTE